MEYTLYETAWLFFIYAFLGWCVEVLYAGVAEGRVVNRGFLNGPVCPIYGVGMLGVLFLLGPVQDRLFLLFFLGMLLCSAIELIGGWVLEKVFHTRWWDYSGMPLQLGGYVCLGFSILWGLAVVFVVRLIQPLIMGLVDWMPPLLGIILLPVFAVLFLVDFIITVKTIVGLKKQLGELERLAAALHNVSDSLSEKLGSSAIAADSRLDEMKEASQGRLSEMKEAGQEKFSEQKERMETRVNATLQELAEKKQQLEARKNELLESMRSAPRFGVRRLSSAFPTIRDSLRERLDRFSK